MEDWFPPPEGICSCGHSVAAHLLTHDGLCGFCFCQRMLRRPAQAVGAEPPPGYALVKID